MKKVFLLMFWFAGLFSTVFGVWEIYQSYRYRQPVQMTIAEFAALENRPFWIELPDCYVDYSKSVPYQKPSSLDRSFITPIKATADDDAPVLAAVKIDAPWPESTELTKLLGQLHDESRSDHEKAALIRTNLSSLRQQGPIRGTILRWYEHDSEIERIAGDLPIIAKNNTPNWGIGLAIMIIGLLISLLTPYGVLRARRQQSQRRISASEMDADFSDSESFEWLNLTQFVQSLQLHGKVMWFTWGVAVVLGLIATGLVAEKLVWWFGGVGAFFGVFLVSAILMSTARYRLYMTASVLCLLATMVATGFVTFAVLVGEEQTRIRVTELVPLFVPLAIVFIIYFRSLLAARTLRQTPLTQSYMQRRKPIRQSLSWKDRNKSRFNILYWRIALSTLVGQIFWMIAFAIYFLAVILWCLMPGGGFLLLLIGSVPAFIGSCFTIRAKRIAAASAKELMELDPRQPVLFLRSFADDEASVDPPLLSSGGLQAAVRGGMRFEEFLCNRFGQLGPVIAIGQPGETSPLLGAARDYFEDSEWQQAIRDWMQKAQIIVMVVGRTEGVGWEFSEIDRLQVRDKLVLFLPPEDPESRAHRWETFCYHCQDDLPPSLFNLRPESVLAISFQRGKLLVMGSSIENHVAYETILSCQIDWQKELSLAAVGGG